MVYNNKLNYTKSKKYVYKNIYSYIKTEEEKINLYQIKDFWLEIWYNEYVYNI